MKQIILLLSLCLGLVLSQGQPANKSSLLKYSSKPRVFVLSDISNEPDDEESFVRFLLYSNQFQIEGLTAVTSTWLRDEVFPEQISAVVDAYAGVVDNLNAHTDPSSPFSSAKYLHSVVKSGPAKYGMTAVGQNNTLSEGGQLFLERLTQPEEEPLWVLAWGGTNVLAEVLWHVQANFNATAAAALRSRVRVYAISDQDDTGPWIREQFPEILYISSTHGWNQYGLAAWPAISGDEYYGFDVGGPDASKVSRSWIRKNIQVGPYGSKYPDYMYIPEGDTPTFLYLIQNGLGVREQPDYGSWGGRYSLVDASKKLNYRHYSDAADRVVGLSNRTYASNHASIWRWRNAFQNDFAARIQWTLPANESKANHHPVVTLNNVTDLGPVTIKAWPNSTIDLDVSATYDPDGDRLFFKWFQYLEPGSSDWNVAKQVPHVNITSRQGGRHARLQIPLSDVVCDGKSPEASGCWVLHVVLEVTDDAEIPLTTYKRVLLQTTNATLSS